MIHQRVRKQWGFDEPEDVSIEALIAEDYQGFDQQPGTRLARITPEKQRSGNSSKAEANTGATFVTETFAMSPASTVSGLYFGHPEARYFQVGKIGLDQAKAYAQRKIGPRPK